MKKSFILIAMCSLSCLSLQAQTWKEKCDVNSDGQVDIKDINTVVAYICGDLKDEDKSKGMLFDFDGGKDGGVPLSPNGNSIGHSWFNTNCYNDDTSISGYYIQFGKGSYATAMDYNTWNEGEFSFEYWCGSWDDVQNITSGSGMALYNVADFSNPEDKVMKFDLNIPSEHPWKAGAMQFIFLPIEKVAYSSNPVEGYSTVGGPNNLNIMDDNCGRGIYMPWKETGSFNTGGKWITVSLPLDQFHYTYFGKTALDWPKEAKDFASLVIFVGGGGEEGTQCTPIIKIDNIRIADK